MNKKEILKKYLRNSPVKWKYQGFVMIPNSIVFNQNIGRAGLMVYWILTLHLFKGKDYCFPSLSTLQRETRLSRHTVIGGIRQLEFPHLGLTGLRRGHSNARFGTFPTSN